MIRKSRPSDLIRGWEPVFAKDHDLVPGITNRYCSPSFETATEPVIGRAFARPVGGLLRMRSNLLKHNNLMLRSERRERLEAWAASDQTISHSSVLERDDISSNRHPAPSFCLSMIFSENRYPLFRIMLQRDDISSNRHPAPSFCLSM